MCISASVSSVSASKNEADCNSHGEPEGAVVKIYIDAGNTYVDSKQWTSAMDVMLL